LDPREETRERERLGGDPARGRTPRTPGINDQTAVADFEA